MSLLCFTDTKKEGTRLRTRDGKTRKGKNCSAAEIGGVEKRACCHLGSH